MFAKRRSRTFIVHDIPGYSIILSLFLLALAIAASVFLPVKNARGAGATSPGPMANLIDAPTSLDCRGATDETPHTNFLVCAERASNPDIAERWLGFARHAANSIGGKNPNALALERRALAWLDISKTETALEISPDKSLRIALDFARQTRNARTDTIFVKIARAGARLNRSNIVQTAYASVQNPIARTEIGLMEAALARRSGRNSDSDKALSLARSSARSELARGDFRTAAALFVRLALFEEHAGNDAGSDTAHAREYADRVSDSSERFLTWLDLGAHFARLKNTSGGDPFMGAKNTAREITRSHWDVEELRLILSATSSGETRHERLQPTNRAAALTLIAYTEAETGRDPNTTYETIRILLAEHNANESPKDKQARALSQTAARLLHQEALTAYSRARADSPHQEALVSYE